MDRHKFGVNSYTDVLISTRIINELLCFIIFSIYERYAQDQREDEPRDETNSGFGSNKKEVTNIETVENVVMLFRIQATDLFYVVMSDGYGVIDRMEAYWSVTKVIPNLSFIVSTSEPE